METMGSDSNVPVVFYYQDGILTFAEKLYLYLERVGDVGRIEYIFGYSLGPEKIIRKNEDESLFSNSLGVDFKLE